MRTDLRYAILTAMTANSHQAVKMSQSKVHRMQCIGRNDKAFVSCVCGAKDATVDWTYLNNCNDFAEKVVSNCRGESKRDR